MTITDNWKNVPYSMLEVVTDNLHSCKQTVTCMILSNNKLSCTAIRNESSLAVSTCHVLILSFGVERPMGDGGL